MTNRVLISIKPFYAEAILNGLKLYEYRRRVFSRKDIRTLVVYETFPKCMVVGEVEFLGILSGTPQDIWGQTSDYGCVTHDSFMAYFDGRTVAHALRLGKATRYSNPTPLSLYNAAIKRPPQSYQYLY